ncbi:hypothetical protein Glove_340g28 [Diversispora epigaea]|uniref:SH3 domain-containing protein n=1 Tax=Diversispora epigaea TaxID=1348612 RepID=A0A397HGW4_9GLOM|nr:hypothetical protein Glove_340g28 [Diversispora epigaea]
MVNSPIPTDLAGECRKASKILNSFIDPVEAKGPDKVIPPQVLQSANGFAIITVVKAGFLFSGRVGSGLVVARLADGSWSAPSAVGTGGMGFGGQIGAEVTDFVIVLNSKDAVKSFMNGGNLTLGGNLSVAAGPIGRNAEGAGSVSLKHVAAIFSYSKTRGLFAGVSIEGSVIIERKDANSKFYHRKVSAKELLSGKVSPPPQADILYRALNAKASLNTGGLSSVYSRSYEDRDHDTDNHSNNHKNNKNKDELGGGRYSKHSFSSSNHNNNDSNHKNNKDDDDYNGGGGGRYSKHSFSSSNYNNNDSSNHQRQSMPVMQMPSAANYLTKSTKSKFEEKGFNDDDDDDNRVQRSISLSNNINQNNTSTSKVKPSLSKSPTTAKPPIAPKPNLPLRQKPITALAMYDFPGEQGGDLGFLKGDTIVITKKTDSTNDWWTGKCNGQEGIFPANYVKLL